MPDYPYDQNKVYSIPMKGKTHLVKPYPEYDGGMVGFLDPTTGEYVGCCGIHFWEDNAKLVANYDFVPGDDV